jgi:cytochrome b561
MPTGYTRLQIALHWIIFLLIGFQLIFGEEIGHAYRSLMRNGSFEPSLAVAAHIWVGIAVLALFVPRFLIKARRGAPPLPEEEPAALKLAANLTHLALYALMLLIPVSGLVAWFGQQRWAAEVHQLMKPVIIILVGLHVLGALYQHFVLKTGVLDRMRKPQA